MLQERLAAELDAAGLLARKGQPGRALEFADLGKLPYVEAVVKESLRMHPTAPLGSNRWATGCVWVVRPPRCGMQCLDLLGTGVGQAERQVVSAAFRAWMM